MCLVGYLLFFFVEKHGVSTHLEFSCEDFAVEVLRDDGLAVLKVFSASEFVVDDSVVDVFCEFGLDFVPISVGHQKVDVDGAGDVVEVHDGLFD